MNITGQWKKITDDDCSKKYPETIKYDTNGIYRADASSTSRVHPLWDVGTYEIKGDTINMSTSNDAIIRYPIVFKDGILTFRDPDGCVIKYQQL